jgi:hypothetical protein
MRKDSYCLSVCMYVLSMYVRIGPLCLGECSTDQIMRPVVCVLYMSICMYPPRYVQVCILPARIRLLGGHWRVLTGSSSSPATRRPAHSLPLPPALTRYETGGAGQVSVIPLHLERHDQPRVCQG